MTEEPVTEFVIHGFHPLNVALPEGEQVEGKIRILLPPVHVQLYDLSMGIDLLKGAHIGGDAPMFGMTITLPEPVDTGDLVKFLIASQGTLELLWAAYQHELDVKGALLR